MKPGKSGIRVKEKSSVIRGREVLLAVDVGLSTGIAVFDDQGQLSRYRSHHLPDKSAFRRWVAGILIEFPELKYVIVEGGGELAEIWQKAVARKKLRFLRIDAGRWRRTFLLPREQRSGSISKENAIALAREVIRESGATITKSLRHDTAEAIMTGMYGVLVFPISSS